ncbi:hypothetical protein GGI35DRAFT_84488 [Trichoderma velutinum]
MPNIPCLQIPLVISPCAAVINNAHRTTSATLGPILNALRLFIRFNRFNFISISS